MPSDYQILVGIINSCRNFEEIICHFEVISAAADGTALLGAGPSAGAVMTKFRSYTHVELAHKKAYIPCLSRLDFLTLGFCLD